MYKLRPYQQQAVNAVYEYLRNKEGNACVVLPTASGKTHVLSQICKDAVDLWSGRVLVLTHVKELVEQNANKASHYLDEDLVGIYSAGLKSRDTEHPVIVAGIQSVYKRACELGSFDLVLIDEVHRLPQDGEGTYRTFLKDALTINPNMRVVGLTATPYRMTTGMICGPNNILNEICFEIGIRELIVAGYLCPLKSKAGKRKVDTSGLHIRGGEFISGEAERLMDDESLVYSACTEIVEQTKDRNSVLIFAAGITHAEHVRNELVKRSGCEVGLVTGNTPALQRDEMLSRFKGQTVKDGLFGNEKPPLKYLVNVNVLTTGFDAPNIDCVVLLRPTNSPGLYAQAVGRGFRLHPSKENCLVLDFGGNILRHGPVDSLEIKDRSSGDGDAPAKECPECNAVIHAAYSICPECGYEFPPPDKNKHDITASDESILSGEIDFTEYRVRDVYYRLHRKKGASDDAPKTMRVTYEVGLGQYVDEWICFEHSGFPRAKAVDWWQNRTDFELPSDSGQAVELAEFLREQKRFREPESILVRHESGSKFDRIVKYSFGDPQADNWQFDDGMEYVPADDEIPF